MENKVIIIEKLEKIYPIFAVVIFISSIFTLNWHSSLFFFTLGLWGMFLIMFGKYIFIIIGLIMIGLISLALMIILSLITIIIAVIGFKNQFISLLNIMDDVKQSIIELFSKKPTL